MDNSEFTDGSYTWQTNPLSARFRNGQRHGTSYDSDDIHFGSFHMLLQDDSGEVVLGFDASTTSEPELYEDQVFVLGSVGTVDGTQRGSAGLFNNPKLPAKPTEASSPFRLSNRLGAAVSSAYQPSFAAAHYWNEAFSSTFRRPEIVEILDAASFGSESKVNLADRISFSNLMATTRLALDSNGLAAQRQLFALVPDEYYDFSSNTFAQDGRYTITTWAEDEEGNQISLRNSLTFGIQEQLAHAWDVRTSLR